MFDLSPATKRAEPRRCVLYGVEGIGKTTAAKGSRLIDLENGSNDIEIARVEGRFDEGKAPRAPKTFDEYVATVRYLIKNPPPEPMVATDSLDWLEYMVIQKVCEVANKPSLSEIEYGKGPGMCVPYWEDLLEGWDRLRAVGKHVLLIAHCVVRDVIPPGSAKYQEYAPKLMPQTAAVIQEWADEVLFFRYRHITTTEKGGFNKERTVAANCAERYIQCAKTLAAVAKNRIGLPDEIDSFSEYKRLLPGFAPTA